MADNNNNDEIRPAVAREIESISSNEGDQPTTFSLRWSFYGEPLNEREMVGIAEAICRSTSVEKLDLSDGSLSGSPPWTTSAFLKRILETHPSLEEIDLSYNHIGDDLASTIGVALKTNTSLRVLCLSNNNIGPHGAKAFAEGLRHNKSLQKLYLGWNVVSDGGATSLAEALPLNKTLEELSLGQCGLTTMGAKALASALEKASLKVLNVGFNQLLQDEGGQALAQSLCENKSLTRLNLDTTGIGDETCKAFAAGLCINSTLKVLGLNYNNKITDVGATALEDALSHMNYAVEIVELLYNDGLSENQVHRIGFLCAKNIRVRTFFQRTNQNIPAIPLGAWPKVLETVECKPDLLFALLKTKPEVCREPPRRNRRRRHPDWLRY